MTSTEQRLAAFNGAESKTMAAFKEMADESFLEDSRFLFHGRVVFSGSPPQPTG